jgi:hypothetical protein
VIVRAVVVAGQRIDADRRPSADPRTTFLWLIEPSELPDFAGKIQNYRAAGTVAKVNLALASLPDSPVARRGYGRIQIGPALINSSGRSTTRRMGVLGSAVA